MHDIVDATLLVLVDTFFLSWPRAKVPFLDRRESLLLILVVNLGFVAYLWLSRAIPRWRAGRLAATWSSAEQSRFDEKRKS